MSSNEASLIERLCEAEDPRELMDWEARDGYYVRACRVSKDDVPALLDVVLRWNDLDSQDVEGGLPIEHDAAELLPVTAWRALADLRAVAAVEPLIDMLCQVDEEFDDWVMEDLPHVFGKIGEAAIEPLVRAANDGEAGEFVRQVAVCGLRYVAVYHPETRNRIAARLTEMMSNVVDDQIDFNSTLLAQLVDLKVVEAAEPIERAFAANLIDVGMMGFWNEVRQELGVEGLGLTMPEAPYNSLDFGSATRNLQNPEGIGAFSEQALFGPNGVDDDAVRAYYKRAYDAFAASAEGQAVVNRNRRLHWSDSLLRFGLDSCDVIVEEMTVDIIEGFLFDYVPGKVSTEADSAAAIVDELAMFWKFLDRAYHLPQAKSIVEWLGAEGLVAELKEAMSNPENFGMAKSFFMGGQAAGFDMHTQAGVNEYMAAFNQSISSKRAQFPIESPSYDEPLSRPVLSKNTVGRNDPCPCGSGKKYKKCCGGPGKND